VLQHTSTSLDLTGILQAGRFPHVGSSAAVRLPPSRPAGVFTTRDTLRAASFWPAERGMTAHLSGTLSRYFSIVTMAQLPHYGRAGPGGISYTWADAEDHDRNLTITHPKV
jgi:hypothetical protein